jgi:hypothetical protein
MSDQVEAILRRLPEQPKRSERTAQAVVNQISIELEDLQDRLTQLTAALESERQARKHLEGIIRDIAELVVNGHKSQNT